jgi:cholesterol transport system auxiliary component
MPRNDPVPRLSRRLLLIAGSSFALAACGSLDKLVGPPEAPQIYALNPTAPQTVPGAKADWALAIAKPDAAENLDSARIALARGDTQLDYYANAVWPDHLTDLVQTALLAGFEGSGRIASVSREEDTLHADYILMTDLRDFEARYASMDGVPKVAVRIVAHLVDARSRQIAASLTVSLDEPASANSVNAVVKAFDAALGKAVAQIVPWALALPGPASTQAPDATPEPRPAGQRAP